MNNIKSVFVTVAVLGLAGCGGGGSDSADSASADLQGKWVSECVAGADSDSNRQEWTFSGNSITQSTVTYIRNTECGGNVSLSLNLPGTLVVDGTTTEVAEGAAKNIDLTYAVGNVSASALATAVLEETGTTLADTFAAQGIDNINNVPLSAFGRSQPELYTIYLVEGDELRLGSVSGSFNGTSPALRSTRLSTVSRLTRQ